MRLYLDILGDFIDDPLRAAKTVRERRPWALGFTSFMATGLSLFLARALSQNGAFALPAPIGLAWTCLWCVVSGIVFAGVLHLIVEAGGGRGSVCGLFVLLGLSSLIWTLSLPATLVLRALPADGWLARAALFVVLASFSLMLKVRSLKDNYGISPAKAWIFVALPYAGAALVLGLIVSLAVAGLVLSLVRFLS